MKLIVNEKDGCCESIHIEYTPTEALIINQAMRRYACDDEMNKEDRTIMEQMLEVEPIFVDVSESEGSMSKTDELEFLKCDLENMITGMTICEGILSKEEKDHLSLHRRCLSVLERIKVAESEDKK